MTISIVELVIPPWAYSIVDSQIARHNAIANPISIHAAASIISHQILSNPLKNLVLFSWSANKIHSRIVPITSIIETTTIVLIPVVICLADSFHYRSEAALGM